MTGRAASIVFGIATEKGLTLNFPIAYEVPLEFPAHRGRRGGLQRIVDVLSEAFARGVYQLGCLLSQSDVEQLRRNQHDKMLVGFFLRETTSSQGYHLGGMQRGTMTPDRFRRSFMALPDTLIVQLIVRYDEAADIRYFRELDTEDDLSSELSESAPACLRLPPFLQACLNFCSCD